jgi:hypothetical protein
MRFKPVPPNWETDASIDATALPWRCRKPIYQHSPRPNCVPTAGAANGRLYASAATYVVLGYHIRVPIDRGSARLVLICARSSRAIDCRESTFTRRCGSRPWTKAASTPCVPVGLTRHDGGDPTSARTRSTRRHLGSASLPRRSSEAQHDE